MIVRNRRPVPRVHILNRRTGGALCNRHNPAAFSDDTRLTDMTCKMCESSMVEFRNGIALAMKILGTVLFEETLVAARTAVARDEVQVLMGEATPSRFASTDEDLAELVPARPSWPASPSGN